MATYYIDFKNGIPNANGLSPESARKSYDDIALIPGDQVLFRRGSFIRGKLDAKRFVTYGAYGEGEAPTFCCSVDVSKTDDWLPTADKNVWKCTKTFDGEVGNLIFNNDECSATLRWTKGELRSVGDFYSNANEGTKTDNGKKFAELYLYCESNPAQSYSHIEAAPFGERCAVSLADGMTLEGIRVINSGVHGMAGNGDGITIRNCEFKNIGGCACHRHLKIRFGNAIEIWQHGNDILIENCTFKNIYDSCVTYQGPGAATEPSKNFICKNCIFDTYGMAAIEYRDKMPIHSVFSGNECKNAGCGFAMLGETKPRMSEIWPQPMGHHVFLWRIDEPTEGGEISIYDNTFGKCPEGSAIYSIISENAEAQISFKGNICTDGCTQLCHFGGRDQMIAL